MPQEDQANGPLPAGAGILTAGAAHSRHSDVSVPSRPVTAGLGFFCAAVVACALLAVAMTVGAATAWQSNEDISRTAEDFVKQRFGSNDPRMRPRAGHLDPRLRLPQCSSPLQAFVRSGTKASSRTVVGVRCSGDSPWKVYVPVDVIVMQPVLVSKQSLPRGHVLTADDVRVEEQDVSRLNGGYLANVDELAGQRLKHPITGGRVLTPAMLAADMIIRRGQSVTLLLRSNGLNITMAGKALADGAMNQRIRVENSASQRVVEGLVRSPEYVEILVH